MNSQTPTHNCDIFIFIRALIDYKNNISNILSNIKVYQWLGVKSTGIQLISWTIERVLYFLFSIENRVVIFYSTYL